MGIVQIAKIFFWKSLENFWLSLAIRGVGRRAAVFCEFTMRDHCTTTNSTTNHHHYQHHWRYHHHCRRHYRCRQRFENYLKMFAIVVYFSFSFHQVRQVLSLSHAVADFECLNWQIQFLPWYCWQFQTMENQLRLISGLCQYRSYNISTITDGSN